MSARSEAALSAGLSAFWAAIAAEYPEAASGDVDPAAVASLESAGRMAVHDWIAANFDAKQPDPRRPDTAESGDLYAPNGLQIRGTLESLKGVADITGASRNDAGALDLDYAGSTDVDWDGQYTVHARGLRVFVDEGGNEWTEDQLSIGAPPCPECQRSNGPHYAGPCEH